MRRVAHIACRIDAWCAEANHGLATVAVVLATVTTLVFALHYPPTMDPETGMPVEAGISGTFAIDGGIKQDHLHIPRLESNPMPRVE